MERFQKVLDALQRESRELITAVQEAMIETLLQDDVEPARIALVLAQRFTEERIASSFPVVCFLDAVLKESTKPCTDPKRKAFFAAISQEFFKLAPSLFAHFHTSPQTSPVLRDKVLRVLRRWAQAQLMNAREVGCLTRAVELGCALPSHSSDVKGSGTAADVKTPHAGEASLDPNYFINGNPGVASDQRTGNTNQAGMRKALTHVQAQLFRSILHQCVLIMEQLPLKSVQLYVEFIRNENFHYPTVAALAFSKDLLVQLQRNSMFAKGNRDTVGTTAGGFPSSTSAPGGGSATDTARHDARNALSRLLHAMPSSAVGEELGDGQGPMNSTFVITRYKSPLLTDTFQQHSLAERTGFGEFRRRQHSSGTLAGSRTAYYPRKEATARRPFRIPSALQAGGGAVQCWFPPPSQWVNEKDVANLVTFFGRGGDLPKFREAASMLNVAGKRERGE